ncbi:LytR/AlgR family response regulator transcription factor [Propionivibrio sp.]|jgi:two-component system response regulator AlgR|uniref:LytR/AlgR family response regulator transcription factor n=1 Tax=Propionivibrio sp. TaxID=2212460 RepID=UPI00272DF1F2|nr:response regulator [Propionivibrio sp.]
MTASPPPTLSVLIVDDEPLARVRLRDLLADIAAEVPNEVVAEASNGVVAAESLKEHRPDVLLVDIRMPKMDGIELARHVGRLENPPAIIFVTAYDSYAVQAFELNAIDYLVKPVRAQRLAAALQKVRSVCVRPAPQQVLAELQQGARTHLSCSERGRMLLIPVHDIVYLKADLKYVTARTAAREYLLDESLTHLEKEFSGRFIRLHRSVLVARDAIAGFERCAGEEAEALWQALLRGVPERLPVSRRQWPLVRSYARQMSS